jgi:hypothetical protein
MCKGQRTTETADSEKVVGGVFGHSAGIGRFSLENRPSGRNSSLLSRTGRVERHSVPGTARGARVEPRFPDHVLSWNSIDLERKLTGFKNYYDDAWGHASLDGNIPIEAGGKSTTQHADISHTSPGDHIAADSSNFPSRLD